METRFFCSYREPVRIAICFEMKEKNMVQDIHKVQSDIDIAISEAENEFQCEGILLDAREALEKLKKQKIKINRELKFKRQT